MAVKEKSPGDDWDRAIKRIDSVETDPERHQSVLIDKAVRDAIRAAKIAGKKASVSVKLTFIPGSDRRIEVGLDLKKTLPTAPANRVSAYADPDEGTLHDYDPWKVVEGLPGMPLGQTPVRREPPIQIETPDENKSK